ncbi:MAG TPA: hypothetical protein VK420_08515, partial [Longimicrobium sp.]|nr:hypothetical protein [Longimicrobium sp.]
MTLGVDGASFPILGIAPAEPVALLLGPGEHRLSLEGSRHATAWSSLPPAPGESIEPGRARLRREWPARTGGGPRSFRLPDPELASPVQLVLRAVGNPPGPIQARIVGGDALLGRVWLWPAPAPSTSFPLDPVSPSDASAAVRVTLIAPPGTRTLHVESDSPGLHVSVSLRRMAGEQEGPAPVSPLPETRERRLLEVAELSRALAKSPGEAQRLTRRALLLSSLGEDGLARADLARLLQLPGASVRLPPASAAGSGNEVWLSPELAVSPPLLLAPALSTAGGPSPVDGALVALVKTARTVSVSQALASPEGNRPGEDYVRARLRGLNGDAEAAAFALVRLHLRTGGLQAGVEALEVMEGLLLREAPPAPEWVAPMAYGLAAKLWARAELPLARQVMASAAARTGTVALQDAEASAGKLEVEVPEDAGAPGLEVLRARVTGPWASGEGRLLVPGAAAVLQLRSAGPREVRAEIFCEALDPQAEDDCALRLRVDGKPPESVVAPHGRSSTFSSGLLAAGPHQVELVLEPRPVRQAAAIRFSTRRPSGEPDAFEPVHPSRS